jgi:hypothetical protein
LGNVGGRNREHRKNSVGQSNLSIAFLAFPAFRSVPLSDSPVAISHLGSLPSSHDPSPSPTSVFILPPRSLPPSFFLLPLFSPSHTFRSVHNLLLHPTNPSLPSQNTVKTPPKKRNGSPTLPASKKPPASSPKKRKLSPPKHLSPPRERNRKWPPRARRKRRRRSRQRRATPLLLGQARLLQGVDWAQSRLGMSGRIRMLSQYR